MRVLKQLFFLVVGAVALAVAVGLYLFSAVLCFQPFTDGPGLPVVLVLSVLISLGCEASLNRTNREIACATSLDAGGQESGSAARRRRQ